MYVWLPWTSVVRSFFFFFQAEDGIRDYKVTGVQTCALPICMASNTSGVSLNQRVWSWNIQSCANRNAFAGTRASSLVSEACDGTPLHRDEAVRTGGG